MKKLLIVFSLMLFGILVNATTVTYSEFSEVTKYDNGKVKMVSGVSNLQDMNGEWKPFTEVVNITLTDYKIRFSYHQYWAEYEPYVIYNGNKYTLEWIVNHFQGVKKHVDINKHRDRYKWALTVSGIPTNLKEGAEYLGFDYVDSNNLQWSDIEIDKNGWAIIIKNKVIISYYDLVWHEYCLDANKETVMIGCLNHDYNYHGEILNHWVQDENGLWSITFDPTTYQANIAQQSGDAQTSGANCTTFDDNDETYNIATTSLPLNCDLTQGWIFQDVDIPQGTTISEALFRLSTWATCGGGQCKVAFYGYDVDDANTWIDNVNEPNPEGHNNRTDANYLWEYGGTDSPNGFYNSRDFNLTEAIQTIINRPGFVQDGNIGILTQEKGTSGRSVSVKAYTYDNTSGAPAPRLTIEYTLLIDYSFSFSYPASGCSDGKGCLGEGCSACTYAYFEPTDLTGESTETEVNPYGQTATLAFIVVDNQSSGSNDFNMSIDLNATAPSGAGWFIKLKLSTITGGWESSCSENALTGCILVDDSNKNIGTINYSASTQDKNFFLWSDFQSVDIGAWNRDANFYSYGVT